MRNLQQVTMMEKIPSFQKNHDALSVGLYAQTDANGVTSFVLRMN